MSSKGPTTGKDPKIPKQEVMVTRHKSAQMKRQLRVKDRSMKHLTDLLKSPTKETQLNKTQPAKKKPSPKTKNSLLKSVEKIQNLPQKTFKLCKVLRKEILLAQDEEYHPNKRKRKLNVNKVVLKPKTAMKVVGEMTGSVKRKYAVPVKATLLTTQKASLSESKSTDCVKISMAEAIQLMDDQLTDEDLMEILTCPSPVWWEDPPDENYIEESLFTRSPGARTPVVEKNEVAPAAVPMEADSGVTASYDAIAIPNLNSKSDNFLKKRSKLEGLLGNIKDKSINVKDKVINVKKPIDNNTTQDNYEDAVLIPLNTCTDEIQVRDEEKHNVNEIKDEIKISDTSKVDENNDKLEAKLSESEDEIILNSSLNEDELLKDLENMDIPVANDVIVIDDDDDFLDKPIPEKTQGNKIEDNEIVNSTIKEEVNEITDKIVKVELPKNLALENSCLDIASPKSLDSLSSKSSITSSKDIDTISDTNVRFLLEDEDDSKYKMASQDSNQINNTESSKKHVLDDSVTVYKIIEEIDTKDMNESYAKTNEITAIVDAKLNDYFKKCKKVKNAKIKSEKTDINKNDMAEREDYLTVSCENCKPTFKKVSENENVKYCLKCSSIFDSKDCTYCIKKTNRTCVPCKIQFCCESYFKLHAIKCEQDSTVLELNAKIPVLS